MTTAIKSWKETFKSIVGNSEFYYEEAYNYLTSYAKEHTLKQYLTSRFRSKKNN